MTAFFRALLCALCLVPGCFRALAADAPQATIVVDPSTVEVGQSAQLQLQVSGGRAVGDAPEIHVEGLEIKYQGKSQMTELSFVQGSPVRRNTLVLAYEVTARRAGSYTIPAVAVEVDGQTLQTGPVALLVQNPIGANPSNTPESTIDKGRAELVLKKPSAWVGEALSLEMHLLVDNRVKWDLDGPPELEGEGFTKTRLTRERKAQLISRDGRQYDLMVIHSLLTPGRAGRIAIGPVTFTYRAQIPRPKRTGSSLFGSHSPFDDFFKDPNMGLGSIEHLKATGDPIMLEVKSLPLASQPKSFSGAVGQFQLAGQASPPRVNIGDPLTVKLTVTGHGNPDRVLAPVLADPAGWRAYAPASSSPKKESDAPSDVNKIFEVPVVPETTHARMPVFEFSYFDPDLAKYVTLRNDPEPLTVDGAPLPPPPPVPGSASADARPLAVLANSGSQTSESPEQTAARQITEDAEAAAGDRMTRQQANTLLEALRGEERRVRLYEPVTQDKQQKPPPLARLVR